MAEMPQFDSLTLCPDYRFIRVVSENGVFYDLVRKWRSREHVFLMKQQYPDACSVSRASVPPCIFRDFTELDGRDAFHQCIWREGTVFLLPLTPTDREKLGPHRNKDKENFHDLG